MALGCGAFVAWRTRGVVALVGIAGCCIAGCAWLLRAQLRRFSLEISELRGALDDNQRTSALLVASLEARFDAGLKLASAQTSEAVRSSVEITDALLSCEAAVDREVFQRDEAIAQEAACRQLALSDVRRTVLRLDASFEETQARTASAVVGLTGQSNHHSVLLCELQRGAEYLRQAVLHAGQFGLTASEIWSKEREALGNQRLIQLMFAEWSMSGFGSRRISTRAIVCHLIRIEMEVAELEARTVDCECNVARLSGDDEDRDSDMERHDLCVSLAVLPAPAEALPLSQDESSDLCRGDGRVAALQRALVSTLFRERASFTADTLSDIVGLGVTAPLRLLSFVASGRTLFWILRLEHGWLCPQSDIFSSPTPVELQPRTSPCAPFSRIS